jgi:hypothetical protein
VKIQAEDGSVVDLAEECQASLRIINAKYAYIAKRRASATIAIIDALVAALSVPTPKAITYEPTVPEYVRRRERGQIESAKKQMSAVRQAARVVEE